MDKKKISLLELESNSNIGLYMFANNKFALIGCSIDSNKKKEIEKILNVPVYKITCLATDLIGIFISGNDEILIIPEVFDYEKSEIEKICKKHDVNLFSINEKQNTFGNNLCFSKDKILINPNYSKDFIENLKKNTKYKIIKIENETFVNIGSICKFLNNKFFLSQEIKENEVKKIIKEIGGIGTINSGSNMIASGIVGNDSGLLLGKLSTTIEIQNIVESLDYI